MPQKHKVALFRRQNSGLYSRKKRLILSEIIIFAQQLQTLMKNNYI